MRFVPETLTFENIDIDMIKNMKKVITALILEGEVPNPEPEWMTEWFNLAGFSDNRQKLLVISTVFPQRILLSLVRELS